MAQSTSSASLRFMLLFISIVTAHPFRHPQSSRDPSNGHRHDIVRRYTSGTSKSLQSGSVDVPSQYNTVSGLRNALINLITTEKPSFERRWDGHRHHHDSTDLQQTNEQLQAKLDTIITSIQSFVDELSSDFDIDLNSNESSISALTTIIDTSTSTATSSLNPTSPTQVASQATESVAQDTVTPSSSGEDNTTTATSSSSSPTSTIPGTRTGPYIFDPMASDNVAVYYSQTDQTSAVPLTSICADPSVDIIILAFVTTFFGPGGWPTLNMGSHCWAASSAQSQAGATGLIDCVGDGFADQVRQCQAEGKKVLLSLGGAKGYSDTSIPSDDGAEELANTLWALFLGGTDNTTTQSMRPFGSVVLDGLDIDNESGTTAHFATLTSSLRTLFQSPQSKSFYLSAAPQCPRPDASIPLSSMQTSIDFVWVQFYNNPACNLDSGAGFLDSLQAWSDDLSNNTVGFVDAGNGVSSPRLLVGAPAFAAAGSGFVDRAEFRTTMQSVEEKGVGNLGGVMLWDGAYGEESGGAGMNGGEGTDRETYMQIAKDVFS